MPKEEVVNSVERFAPYTFEPQLVCTKPIAYPPPSGCTLHYMDRLVRPKDAQTGQLTDDIKISKRWVDATLKCNDGDFVGHDIWILRAVRDAYSFCGRFYNKSKKPRGLQVRQSQPLNNLYD